LTPVICGILAEGVTDAEAEVDEFDDCANAPLRSTRNSDVMRWTCIVGREGNECAETVEEFEGKFVQRVFCACCGIIGTKQTLDSGINFSVDQWMSKDLSGACHCLFQ
jgi:hypothetical protein